MDRPNFEMAQNKATEFLLNHDVGKLIFDPREPDLSDERIIIDTRENYAVLTNRNVEDFSGKNIEGCYVVRARNYRIILYSLSESGNAEHTIFGISHELGHIYCNHKGDSDINEIEANFFAAQLLMPEIVIIYILKNYTDNKITDLELMRLFGVSYEAASKKIRTMNRKGFWNCGAIDKQLLEKYKPIVDQYYQRQKITNTLFTVSLQQKDKNYRANALPTDPFI